MKNVTGSLADAISASDPSRRCLVIGDIHGCRDELLELLDRAGLNDGDAIVALGDIVDRGPESVAVVGFFQSRPGAFSLIGNHERKHVRSFRGEVPPACSQVLTRRQFGEVAYPGFCEWADRLPRFVERPDALLVHGFFEPGVPLALQRESVLVGTISGENHLKRSLPGPWYEHYDGQKPLIVGHLVYRDDGQPLVYRDRVFGLDTGCCHGLALTGLLLPEFRFVSVPARRNYWAQAMAQESEEDLLARRAREEQLSWEQVEGTLRGTAGKPDLPRQALERAARLQDMSDRAGTALEALWNHLNSTHEALMASIRQQIDPEQLSAQKLARTYAAGIQDPRLARFLHPLRKGRLDRVTMKEMFHGPGALLAFANELGLDSTKTND